MSRNHQKRRQSRLGRPTHKPTDQRRDVAGEPGFTHESAQRILAEKGTRLITTDRVKGGIHYNVVIRNRPRTLKVSA